MGEQAPQPGRGGTSRLSVSLRDAFLALYSLGFNAYALRTEDRVRADTHRAAEGYGVVDVHDRYAEDLVSRPRLWVRRASEEKYPDDIRQAYVARTWRCVDELYDEFGLERNAATLGSRPSATERVHRNLDTLTGALSTAYGELDPEGEPLLDEPVELGDSDFFD